MYNRDIYYDGVGKGRAGQGKLVISRICHLISSSKSGLTNAPGYMANDTIAPARVNPGQPLG